MSYPYLQKILTARVYDVARETPLDPMPTLTRRLGNQILLKREDLQPVFSFKLRGAYHKMVNLPREVREKGVICASAGNHAQGVALSAKRLGIKAVIVMPQTTPSIKVEAVRALGGEAILHGDSYDDAYQLTQELMEKHGYAFIHPFDDPDVIAGQGTVALELLRQHPDPLDAVFIPVGGGGLAAGMAVYIKALRPDIKVIGVEPEDAPCMHHALEKKRRIILDQVGIFADGVAVRQAGKENYRICREHMDEVILVTTDEICAATKDVFDDTRVMAEPAGALSVAGLKKHIEREGARDGRYAAVLSGANINFDRLRHVTERAELGEHREALFAATIPERPGSFRAFCEAIGKRGITEFNYRYADQDEACIFVGVQLSGGEPEGRALLEDLRAKGYPIEDLSGNEVAKVHLRHMVGGHASHVGDEIVYRFEFPERPGALMRFLSQMGQDWNISLFHYRNHGAAYGRVLVGIQVPPRDKPRFRRFLKELGYMHWEETENPVYRLFLG